MKLRGWRTWIRSMFALSIFAVVSISTGTQEFIGLGIAIAMILVPTEGAAAYKSGEYQKYKNETK